MSQPDNRRTMISEGAVAQPGQTVPAPLEIPVLVQPEQSVVSTDIPAAARPEQVVGNSIVALPEQVAGDTIVALPDQVAGGSIMALQEQVAVDGIGALPEQVAGDIIVAAEGGKPSRRKGRPRKYGPGGSLEMTGSAGYRKKSRVESGFRKGTDTMTPISFNVREGEDLVEKLRSFLLESGMSMSILSASGEIKSAALNHPSGSTGTITHEGRFGIASLSGTFVLTEQEGQKCPKGSLSVMLYGRDCQVFGGAVVGSLMAASTIQVVMAVFHADDVEPSTGHNEPEPETPSLVPVGGEAGVDSPPSCLHSQ